MKIFLKVTVNILIYGAKWNQIDKKSIQILSKLYWKTNEQSTTLD